MRTTESEAGDVAWRPVDDEPALGGQIPCLTSKPSATMRVEVVAMTGHRTVHLSLVAFALVARGIGGVQWRS